MVFIITLKPAVLQPQQDSAVAPPDIRNGLLPKFMNLLLLNLRFDQFVLH